MRSGARHLPELLLPDYRKSQYEDIENRNMHLQIFRNTSLSFVKPTHSRQLEKASNQTNLTLFHIITYIEKNFHKLGHVTVPLSSFRSLLGPQCLQDACRICAVVQLLCGPGGSSQSFFSSVRHMPMVFSELIREYCSYVSP